MLHHFDKHRLNQWKTEWNKFAEIDGGNLKIIWQKNTHSGGGADSQIEIPIIEYKFHYFNNNIIIKNKCRSLQSSSPEEALSIDYEYFSNEEIYLHIERRTIWDKIFRPLKDIKNDEFLKKFQISTNIPNEATKILETTDIKKWFFTNDIYAFFNIYSKDGTTYIKFKDFKPPRLTHQTLLRYKSNFIQILNLIFEHE